MIHKEIITGRGINKLILTDIQNLVLADPVGRINNFTGKPKQNGAQHSVIWNQNLFPLYAELDLLANLYNLKIGDVWTNICYPNCIGGKHMHSGEARISGCYYIDIPENSGSLEFETGEIIYPKAGEIYWWSSDKIHWTNKNNSDKNRYSIAFNLDTYDIKD
jgi:hypothetical protein